MASHAPFTVRFRHDDEPDVAYGSDDYTITYNSNNVSVSWTPYRSDIGYGDIEDGNLYDYHDYDANGGHINFYSKVDDVYCVQWNTATNTVIIRVSAATIECKGPNVVSSLKSALRKIQDNTRRLNF